MTNRRTTTTQPLVYQIRLQGHLGPQWTEWFEGLTVTLEENGDTLLTGSMADQSALYGVLKKARDLGMNLRSVNQIKFPSNTENIPSSYHIKTV